MTFALLAATLYESPAVVALGPVWSAIFVGFAAVDWWGGVYLTRAGEEYLVARNVRR